MSLDSVTAGVLSGLLAGALAVASLGFARAAVLVQGTAATGGRLRGPARSQRRVPLASPPPWLGPRLAETGVEVDARLAWSGWLAASAAAAAGAAVVGGLGLAAFTAGAAVAAPVVGWTLLRHRGEARMEAALPAMVDGMARALRSGASLRQAVAEAAQAASGELGSDLVRVARATEQGATLVESLEEWSRRRPLAGVRLVVAALSLGAETGGASAQAVDGVAATLRQRLAAQSEARALATQARVSAAVIALAPVAFCLVALGTDPRTFSFLLGTVPGLGFLGAGLALDMAGALWMARITRIEP